MFHFKQLLLAIVILSFVFNPMEMKPAQTINVMFSRINRALHRLDMEIVENFGKKFNLKIEYMMTNVTLNEVFNTKDRFEKFSQSPEYM